MTRIPILKRLLQSDDMETTTVYRLVRLSLHGSFLAALHLFAASVSVIVLMLTGFKPPAASIPVLTAVLCLIAYGMVSVLMLRMDSPIMMLDRLWMVGAIVPVALLMEGVFLYPVRGSGLPLQDYTLGLLPHIHLQFATYLLCLLFNLMFFRSRK